jgi:N-acetylglucosaminyl-diphospho-decaprenol L-rhamnosyltransferase
VPRNRLDPAARYGDALAIVTVTYSPGEMLERLLASVPTATRMKPLVVLSDNGSTDGSIEPALERHPFAQVLRNGDNLGYGGAVNAAARTLSDEVGWILVVNPDSRFTPGSVDELLRVIRSDDRIGSVGPLIVSEQGVPYPSARQLPSLRTGILHAVLAGVWPGNPWSTRYRQDDVVARGEQVTTGWLSGACVLVRRSAFEQVGGFDDRFFMYFEDVDLGKQLGDAGWENVYVPSAKVVHVGATTASRYPSRTQRAHHESAYLYMAKKYPQWWLAPVRWAIKAGLAVRLWSIMRHVRKPDEG